MKFAANFVCMLEYSDEEWTGPRDGTRIWSSTCLSILSRPWKLFDAGDRRERQLSLNKIMHGLVPSTSESPRRTSPAQLPKAIDSLKRELGGMDNYPPMIPCSVWDHPGLSLRDGAKKYSPSLDAKDESIMDEE